MLRKTRIVLAAIFFTFITLLFLDFTGTLHAWFGWMAKIQFLPAILAVNAGIVIILVILTLLCGRVYCSVICPLGVFQDTVSWINGKRGKKHRMRFSWSPAKSWLRYGVLVLFIIALIAGIGSFVALLEPYSAYGRMVSNLFAPLYQWGNNLLAYLAERIDSYAFYSKDVWMKSIPTFVTAAVTFTVIVILAWRNGRTWCNTVCPVGTVLGWLSRFSIFAVRIDADKCTSCSLCTRGCKASCIDYRNHKIDYSRCVACMDCIDNCTHGAISYTFRYRRQNPASGTAGSDTPENPGISGNPPSLPAKDRLTANISATDIGSKVTGTVNGTTRSVPDSISDQIRSTSRRNFISATAVVAATAIAKAQEKKVDGGLATIEKKAIPERKTAIVPPGALSLRNFYQHCTACQLCVSVCPNDVLRPSGGLMRLMQPEMSYERGYCRPECTKCSDVCPAGAIRPVTVEEKSSVQIGHAVWIKKNCIVFTDDVECGNCARHCPTGAIQMVEIRHRHRRRHGTGGNPEEERATVRIPVINQEKCIGCGACENLCPARPFTAIYVEGHEVHSEI